MYTFALCVLVHIDIPPSVRAIKHCAFEGNSGLATVILNDGLEGIGVGGMGNVHCYPSTYPPPPSG